MIRRKFALAAFLTLAVQTAMAAPPRIAIIIDDLGYALEAGRRAIDLPGPVAYAILPDTPRGRTLAVTAHDHGKEILLHMPLEAANFDGPVEPDVIMLDMSHADFERVFDRAIRSVPFVVGVSSHRGSLVTRHPGHMVWLMEAIRQHHCMFFIDSYTTPESVALRIAGEQGVSAARRDVFLDDDRSPSALEHEFDRLKSLARERGRAIAIGHPYSETLDMLERELPTLTEEGYELVPVSSIVAQAPGGDAR
jgi:uncharacterized protein